MYNRVNPERVKPGMSNLWPAKSFGAHIKIFESDAQITFSLI